MSPRLPITCGVPQGSILGPLYFIIYVNDLLELFDDGDVGITLYADDTVLYTASKCPKTAVNQLNTCLLKLSTWCNDNRLTINVKKTKHMIVSSMPNDHVKCVAFLNDVELDCVHSYNYLGVIIDDKLTFGSFLKEKCGRVNQRIYQLGKMRKFITRNIANLIYKQTILPISEYADLMVESGPKGDIDRLQTLQDKALRIVDNNYHKTLDGDMLSNLYRVMPLKLRRAEHLGLVMYRLSAVDDHIEQPQPYMQLRNTNKIKFKQYKRQHEKYLKSPMSRGITLWDRIPESVQRSTTKVKFKRGIRPHLTTLTMPVPK